MRVEQRPARKLPFDRSVEKTLAEKEAQDVGVTLDRYFDALMSRQHREASDLDIGTI